MHGHMDVEFIVRVWKMQFDNLGCVKCNGFWEPVEEKTCCRKLCNEELENSCCSQTKIGASIVIWLGAVRRENQGLNRGKA
jgi:hypothetical protein